MKQIHFSRKTRQLSRLVDELKSALKNAGNIGTQTNRLKIKISLLLNELKGILSTHRLRKILGSFAVVFGLSFSTNSSAQYFLPPVQNPFGIVNAIGNVGTIENVDLDGDGDFDILQGGYYGAIEYYENTGTSIAPAFAPPVQNPFGLTATYYFAFLTGADLDGDGDVDLLVGEYYGNMEYFENTGTNLAPAFAAPVQNPYGLTAVTNYSWPELVDLDGDGDFDVLVGGYGGDMEYFENTGTAMLPAFAPSTINPFGLSTMYFIAIPEFADLDADGDLDLYINEYYGAIQYFENIGTVNLPSFAAPVANPFGFTVTSDIAAPDFVDLDGDGDLDLLTSELNLTIQYYENLNCTPGLGTDTQAACGTFDWIDGNTYTVSNNTATFNIPGGSMNGCDSIVTLDLTINTVDISVTTAYPSATANATGGATYQWLDCDNSNAIIVGQTAQTFTAASNGDYSVEVTENGCVDTSLCITLSNVGIEKNPLFNTVSVYPNPTTGNVNIDLGDLNSVNIKVFTLDGKVLFRKENISGSTYVLELEGAPGIYFIELIAKGEKQVFKVVKK